MLPRHSKSQSQRFMPNMSVEERRLDNSMVQPERVVEPPKLKTQFMNERVKKRKIMNRSGDVGMLLNAPNLSEIKNHTVESSFLKNV